MITYRMADARDMDNIIDFINMVFSMLRVPHNFETLLPKVYAKEFSIADIHAIAEEDGKLCGCVAMYEFPMRVGDTSLRVGYIGSVSAHPRVRGKGVMAALMQMQLERARERGLDLMALGGQRQRYQYHGFETGGETYQYSISRPNVRHALADCETDGLVFSRMTQEDVLQALALYDAQRVAGARTQKNFIATLESYHKQAWTVKKNGAFAGYISSTEDGARLGEIVMEDASMILPAIKAWMLERDIRLLHVNAAPHDVTLNSRLASICEDCSIDANCMIRVLRPESVLHAYMQLKDSIDPLEKGEYVLGWEGLGAYLLSVSDAGIVVEKTEREPQTWLTGIQAHQLLFSHNRFGAPKACGMPRGWFPLPLHIPEPDSF